MFLLKYETKKFFELQFVEYKLNRIKVESLFVSIKIANGKIKNT